jgi:CHRD domain
MKCRPHRAALAVLGALLALASAPTTVHAKTPRPLTFIAIMNGGQVVPPSTSNGLGVGFLTFDNATKRLCYSLTYSGMLGTETEAHLHGDALPGQTNQVLYDMGPYGSPKVACLGPIKPNEERLLKQEKMYIQIHTDIFVAGEIRGQVLSIR